MFWRDVRTAARAVVHATFRVPAWLLDRDGQAVAVWVRVHNRKIVTAGDPDDLGYAQRYEQTPKAVFWRGSCVPKRNDILVVADAAYRIENVLPYDSETQPAEVIRMSASDMLADGLDPDIAYGGMAEPVPL